MSAVLSTGLEWLIDAEGCRSEPLGNVALLRALCDEIIAKLELRVVGSPVWHQFPDPPGWQGHGGQGLGGATGMYLLSESHLTIHTFPEFQSATLNLYCCRPTRHWNWEAVLAEHLGATHVLVRSIVRGASRLPSASAAHSGVVRRADR